MKLSDYVFRTLADFGAQHVFMVVGGANAHLADSLARTNGLTYICTRHEQAAAMAAEGYARTGGRIGAVLTTQGPSATNALTGVAGAWCDSIPMIIISGQVVSNLVTDGRTIRQLGTQQLNVVEIMKSVTKYAVMVSDPSTIKYHLEKALHLAKSGRPGPVWIDIPTEIQRAEIDPDKLDGFTRPASEVRALEPPLPSTAEIQRAIGMIREAKRPLLIAGHGIRLANAVELFRRHLVPALGFPVITTWNGVDLLDHNNSLYAGHAGVMGQRGANYAVANADLILSIGSRLDTRQVGNSPELYAPNAKKIVVDIDSHELAKGLIAIDLPIKADAAQFTIALVRGLRGETLPNISTWVTWCRRMKQRYPVVLEEYEDNRDGVNSYIFIRTLSSLLKDGDVVVTDMGTSFTCTMQAFRSKGGNQRLFTNSGLASMGFGLPATIGAAFGKKTSGHVVGIYGDGGFQMNIQELETVIHYGLPLKIFILDSKSYLTIEHTQEDFFGGRYVGSNPASGYSAPAFDLIANAYGLASCAVSDQNLLEQSIKGVLATPGPVLCVVTLPAHQALIPLSKVDKARGYAGAPLEVMYPYLPDEEHKMNMLEKA